MSGGGPKPNVSSCMGIGIWSDFFILGEEVAWNKMPKGCQIEEQPVVVKMATEYVYGALEVLDFINV